MINRRNFFKTAAISASSMMLSGSLAAFSKSKSDLISQESVNLPSNNLMKEVMTYRKIDAYANAYFQDNQLRAQIDYADRLGIEKMFIAAPVARTMGVTTKDFMGYNDLVLNAMRKHPHRFIGQLTLSPVYLKESLEEIRRCTDNGMVGLKLYNQVKINDPSYYPIIEKFIDLKMIIHAHGESQIGVGGYRMKYNVKSAPNTSVPEDFVDVAKRYPEAMFQYAHIGGGSDWEYACKAFAKYPNIFVDTGGSNNEENMIDFAVKHLGEDRVFFGCDGSYYQGVGKILASSLTEPQKKKVFFDNYNFILKKSGHNII